jgi:hypothetical protein
MFTMERVMQAVIGGALFFFLVFLPVDCIGQPDIPVAGVVIDKMHTPSYSTTTFTDNKMHTTYHPASWSLSMRSEDGYVDTKSVGSGKFYDTRVNDVFHYTVRYGRLSGWRY